MIENFRSQKSEASAWFLSLRDDIIARFESIEQQHKSSITPAQFDVNETKRTSEDGLDAGGGLMSVMRNGRVFEKVGVNISTVFGELGTRAQEAMVARKGWTEMRKDPRFWAS